jgi:tetratricopeptide (TPR) repeat protein
VDKKIVIALLLAISIPARADDAEARRHYDRALRAYNLQEFKIALDEFRGAYNEKPDPAFLFNIGQSQRQLGMYEAAAKSYRAYLAQSPNAANRSEVERLAQQMDEAAKEAHAKEPPTGTRPPTESPPPHPAVVETVPPVDNGKSLRLAGIVTADVGVGVVALGAIFAGLSFKEGQDAYRGAIYNHSADVQQTNFRNGDIACFVVGGVAVGTGLTLWLLGRRARSSHAAIAPTSSGIKVAF